MKKLDKSNNHRGKYRNINNNDISNSPGMKVKSSFCSSNHSHSTKTSNHSHSTKNSHSGNSSAKGSMAKTKNSSRESDGSYSEYSINDSPAAPPPKPRVITVNITTIMGKIIPIQMQISGTIAELKALISEAAGISPESQMLVFCGKQLNEDTQTLKILNIQDRSNLQLVLKMAGGV